MKYSTILWFPIVFVIGIGTANIDAQVMDTVAIHGFGGWAYGRTDNENRYLMGNEDGNYDHVNFSLNISADPYEKLSLSIQAGYTESRDEDEVGLDYAFAEWYFSDMLRFRAGKVKAPYMLYTEVYDVGTIRPFFTLPQGLYRQIAAEAYKGAGIAGALYTTHGWELQYDVYGGTLSLQPNPYLNIEEFRFDSIDIVGNDLIGGRLTVQTPLTGLSVAFSSYTTEFDFGLMGQQEVPLDDRYILIGTSVEYLSDRWWLRSEYLTQKESSKILFDVVYAEVAYRLTNHWQVAARYEFADFDLELPGSELFPESIYDHQEMALGMNYWLNPNLVFKVSYHLVDGNRFAFPENAQDYLESLLRGGFEETTHLILLGAQFSF